MRQASKKSESSTARSRLPAGMSDGDFHRLSSFIYSTCGIQLPERKKIMLQARLQKRLRVLEIGSYSAYTRLVLNSEEGKQEIPFLIDAVTTNTTDFFREAHHFEYLKYQVLPRWMAERLSGRPFTVWSAGCSIGAEPYTLGMVLADFAAGHPGFMYRILGTDISGEALQTAQRAVYTIDQAKGVPERYKKKYMLRSKDKTKPLVRVGPEIRRTVNFSQLNFMTAFTLRSMMDVVFCRNVLIYFDRETQFQIVRRLCSQLHSGGYLFIGHSESLAGMDLPVRQLIPTVYLKS
ncbi:CheR family methyltransferase [Desulfobaculum bizertense]|uniref:protein-glutamate O-methyltransferase n=2 Tax=Desulfobaculum TaxID=1433996 RepID=A0A1T4WWI5_9BACT|nr:chemotaxis protein methyltransferase CheR [Desulfobaculum bizertense DSM 18034]